MAKFTKSEKNLLSFITDDRLLTSLSQIKEASEDIWASDAPRIIRDYTDHGQLHCQRLSDLAFSILQANDRKPLQSNEMYLLLASIYLHDIGMQCDIKMFPEIKSRAELLGAKFSQPFPPTPSSDFSIEEQKEIRSNHNFLSASWIDYAQSTGLTALGNASKSIPEELVDDLIDICKYHSKLAISSCQQQFLLDPNSRKQLIAAILRFADELDIDSKRVNIETVKYFAINSQNAIYWWIHNNTKIVFSDRNVIEIIIRLSPKDYEEISNSIHKLFITEFQTKNLQVLTVLAQNGIPIIISSDSKVISHARTTPLPIEVIEEINKIQSQKNNSLLLAEDISIWLRAIKYEVSQPQVRNEKSVDMNAIIDQGALRQHVLVRCIDGEINTREIEDLDTILDRNTPYGWIISNLRVSQSAREKAAKNSSIRIFNLYDFLYEMVWGSYIDATISLVEKNRIPQIYIDLACYKQDLDQNNTDLIEKYSSLDSYIDSWLKEKGKNHISLLGEFGSGKTWFCRHYAYRQILKYKNDPENERLPLLITLRSFAKAMTAQQLINDALLEQYKLPFIGSAFEVFKEINRRGKFLLILDGFDEMARQVDYQTVVDNFWELAKLIDEGSKVILTSRTEYFRWANESVKILSGEEFGRRTLVLKPPKFEVLYLEQLSKKQIKQVIINRLGVTQGEIAAKAIIGSPNLAEMATKPIIVELLLAALDEVNIDFLTNTSQVYLYATNRLLLRNIETNRTFTTTADKIFFLCELAWEMINSGELRIHYTAIPIRIKSYFESKIRDQHELDTWDSDLRSQTLLHRDSAGYYEFAHKSLAEYFVALKFSAELGCLSEVFQETYLENDGSLCKMPINQKNFEELRTTFGKVSLSTAQFLEVRSFIIGMLKVGSDKNLWQLVMKTKNENPQLVMYTGGNAFSLLNIRKNPLPKKNLAGTLLNGAYFRSMDLSNFNFSGASLKQANLEGCNLVNVNFSNTDLSDIEIRDIDYWSVAFNLDASCIAVGQSDSGVKIFNTKNGHLLHELRGTYGWVRSLCWSDDNNFLAGVCHDSIIVWDINSHSIVFNYELKKKGALHSGVLGEYSLYNLQLSFKDDGICRCDSIDNNVLRSITKNISSRNKNVLEEISERIQNASMQIDEESLNINNKYTLFVHSRIHLITLSKIDKDFRDWFIYPDFSLNEIRIPNKGHLVSFDHSPTQNLLVTIIIHEFGNSEIVVWKLKDGEVRINNCLWRKQATLNCKGMKIEGAIGLDKDIIKIDNKEKNLRDFFINRGAKKIQT